jgi:uncharacterized protein (TIGR02117 family)
LFSKELTRVQQTFFGITFEFTLLKTNLKAIKTILYSLKRIGRFLLLFIVLYGVAIFVLSKIPINSQVKNKADDVSIYIKTNGVHTDIVVPITNEIKDWSRVIKIENTKGKESCMAYIAFGWGDKGFYLNTPRWSDLKYSTAFNAAFGLGESAMHATFFKEMSENNDCIRLGISKENYKRLVAYIEDSFQLDANQLPTFISSTTYGLNDSFYEAKGSYTMFYTCNTWANDALKSANQKAALWTVTDTGIFCHYP